MRNTLHTLTILTLLTGLISACDDATAAPPSTPASNCEETTNGGLLCPKRPLSGEVVSTNPPRCSRGPCRKTRDKRGWLCAPPNGRISSRYQCFSIWGVKAECEVPAKRHCKNRRK